MNRQSNQITALYCLVDYPGYALAIEVQKNKTLDYARKHGLENPVLFVDDGFIGTNTNRPEFQRMMEEIKAGNVGAIVVTSLDRLIRGYLQSAELADNLLAYNGVSLHTVEVGLYRPDNDMAVINALSAAFQKRGGGYNG